MRTERGGAAAERMRGGAARTFRHFRLFSPRRSDYRHICRHTLSMLTSPLLPFISPLMRDCFAISIFIADFQFADIIS